MGIPMTGLRIMFSTFQLHMHINYFRYALQTTVIQLGLAIDLIYSFITTSFLPLPCSFL